MNKAIWWTMPALALAACGGSDGEGNKAKGGAQSLQAGQYEVSAEVTQFRAADKGTPKIDTQPGTRTTRSVCVTDGANLPPALFADEGFDCRNAGTGFARGGTLNINLSCRRAGLPGEVGYTVTGSYQADSFEVERQLTSSFTTDGDVVIGSTVRGRRTGDCTAEPAGNSTKGKSK